MRPDESVLVALNEMGVGGFRHIPLVDEGGRLRGILSGRDVLDYIERRATVLIPVCSQRRTDRAAQPVWGLDLSRRCGSGRVSTGAGVTRAIPMRYARPARTCADGEIGAK